MHKKPAAIVLCQVLTGFSTARSLSAAGVEVHAVSFSKTAPIHFSRHFKQIKLIGKKNDEKFLIDWLTAYAQKIGNMPVVIPTSDVHALMLAKHYEQLSIHCRLSTTSYEELWNIISKGALYASAERAGVDVIPSIHEPNLEQLKVWSESNPAPYFLKPFYEKVDGCKLTDKNLILQNREDLLAYAAKHGTKALVIQRMINGGDGYIFDCYGLCDASEKVVTMASHRRWRQNPPNVGTTTFGEIPGYSDSENELALFTNTSKLLDAVKHHGIFGIEWLQDRETGKSYLIDFNARPFSSIGHLTSCGLNLPYLAYQELTGEDISSVETHPTLKHSLWIDLLRDLQSLRERRTLHQISYIEWLKSLLSCRQFAYWNWLDPGPGIYRSWQIALMAIKFASKRIKF